MTKPVSKPRQIDSLLTAAQQAADALAILERLLPIAADEMSERADALRMAAKLAVEPETKARMQFEAWAADEDYTSLISADDTIRRDFGRVLPKLVEDLHHIANPALDYAMWKEMGDRLDRIRDAQHQMAFYEKQAREAAYRLPDVDPFQLFEEDIKTSDDREEAGSTFETLRRLNFPTRAETLAMPPLGAKPYSHHVTKNPAGYRPHTHVVIHNLPKTPRLRLVDDD